MGLQDSRLADDVGSRHIGFRKRHSAPAVGRQKPSCLFHRSFAAGKIVGEGLKKQIVDRGAMGQIAYYLPCAALGQDRKAFADGTISRCTWALVSAPVLLMHRTDTCASDSMACDSRIRAPTPPSLALPRA